MTNINKAIKTIEENTPMSYMGKDGNEYVFDMGATNMAVTEEAVFNLARKFAA